MTFSPPSPDSSSSRFGVVVLVSGSGSLLQALIDADQDAYRIRGVVSDRDDAFGVERARRAGIPVAIVRPRDFPDRATWDGAIARAVEVFSPDLVVLAGFMRILGAAFLERFGGRAVNTHPALLPAFPGAHGVRDALAYGVKVTGCSMIFIDDGEDTGPVVAQRPVLVEEGDDEASLHERIKVAEREMLVDVVVRMSRDGWTVNGRKVLLHG